MKPVATFDLDCTLCPRLSTFLAEVRVTHPDYYARPVPSFGDSKADLLIVGLAPGMHGANATGRPFTGDHAGILLYETLDRYGFASTSLSTSADDSLKLKNCRITNAVKCLPPQNKPVGAEINNCNHYLAAELSSVPEGGVLFALGSVAHTAVLKALGLRIAAYKFAHGAEHELERNITLIDSYHCSRYNTNTRRLTPAMFQNVISRARELVDAKL